MVLRIHGGTANMRYMALPMRPGETEDMDEAGIVTRDCMIGLAVPRTEAMA